MHGPGLPLKGPAAPLLVFCGPELPGKHLLPGGPHAAGSLGQARGKLCGDSEKNAPAKFAEDPGVMEQRCAIPAGP